jgi:hypothetical protein
MIIIDLITGTVKFIWTVSKYGLFTVFLLTSAAIMTKPNYKSFDEFHDTYIESNIIQNAAPTGIFGKIAAKIMSKTANVITNKIHSDFVLFQFVRVYYVGDIRMAFVGAFNTWFRVK